jgi:Na+-transporting NADH:ubiquinone oxidoreductase subunit NqrD
MDRGEIVYIAIRLTLGASASFFAIMLWSKIRDTAWMLMVIGTIASYVETIHSILNRFGIRSNTRIAVGSVPLESIILPNLPTVFFITAFIIMVVRKYKKRQFIA